VKTKILELIKDTNNEFPKYWFIYVDDCFIIWNESCGQFKLFLEKLNNFRKGIISFTVEFEKESCLPFLDLNIKRKDSSISIDLYQKPTNVNRYLNFKSHHNIRSKISTIDYFVSRAQLLSGEKYQKQIIETTKQLINNGYPSKLIMKRIQVLTNKRLSDKTKVTKDYDHNVVIPYVKGISGQIALVFKKYNSRISYCRLRNDLHNVLYNHKTKIPKEMQNGVYRINCLNCGKAYIGETKRYLKVRKKEHKTAVDQKLINKSPVAEHCVCSDHFIDWDNMKIIKRENNDFLRKFYESIAIKTIGRENLMNRNSGEVIPYVWHKFLKKV